MYASQAAHVEGAQSLFLEGVQSPCFAGIEESAPVKKKQILN
jgi:hypothetical protein